ncbi:MAG: thioredoxin family protein [Caulobacteraceae bacterium]|nr:thioredoxin family protein [Caulobacteraceae bacterium]
MARLPSFALALAALFLAAAAAPVPARHGAAGLTAYPSARETCPAARSTDLFQKCRPQADVLAAALAEARAQDKAVLIEIGADWCASCIVMDRYINGWFAPGKEPPAAGTAADAQRLAAFMAANFVVARLNVDEASINPALRPLGLTADVSHGVPAFHVLYAGRTREVRTHEIELRAPGRQGMAFSRSAVLAKFRQALAAVRPSPRPA